MFPENADVSHFDYYRQTMQEKNDISCVFSLTKDGKWTRSDDQQKGIWWLQKEGDDSFIMINYSSTRQDFWNSGDSKGSRKFVKRVTDDTTWWECIEPKWWPTTKMLTQGV